MSWYTEKWCIPLKNYSIKLFLFKKKKNTEKVFCIDSDLSHLESLTVMGSSVSKMSWRGFSSFSPEEWLVAAGQCWPSSVCHRPTMISSSEKAKFLQSFSALGHEWELTACSLQVGLWLCAHKECIEVKISVW